MRYRIANLLLLAVLPAMPMSLSVTAAPVPKSKYPAVYALVYVGNGTNNKANDKRIAKQAELLRGLCNPIFEKNFHVQSLEGAAVLRVWCMHGTPEKQAEIINEIVDHYLAPVPSRRKSWEKVLGIIKYQHRELVEKDPANVESIQSCAKEIMRIEKELRSLPYLLERAAADKKRP